MRKLLKYSAVGVALAALFTALYFAPIFVSISRLQKENPKKTALMEYREKEWEQKGKRYRINQVWVPLPQISPYLIKAVLIAEDDKFWNHQGFDYKAIKEALERDLKEKRFKLGGSTVSQQLAKNLYLSPSKTPLRKINEAIITWRMEKVLTKKRILELYLNLIEWGEGIYGAEAASRHYYGKTSAALTPQEAARLAAIIPNPRRYNINGKYVTEQAGLIYSIMVERGMVVPEYKEVTQDDKIPPLAAEPK